MVMFYVLMLLLISLGTQAWGPCLPPLPLLYHILVAVFSLERVREALPLKRVRARADGVVGATDAQSCY